VTRNPGSLSLRLTGWLRVRPLFIGRTVTHTSQRRRPKLRCEPSVGRTQPPTASSYRWVIVGEGQPDLRARHVGVPPSAGRHAMRCTAA